MSTEVRFDWKYAKPRRQMRKWNLYNVFCNGELLVENTRDPEFNACREYLRQHPEAEDDIACFYHEGKKSLVVRIGAGAKLRAKEGERYGPIIAEYIPCPDFHLDGDSSD